jgi:hypothetical protein
VGIQRRGAGVFPTPWLHAVQREALEPLDAVDTSHPAGGSRNLATACAFGLSRVGARESRGLEILPSLRLAPAGRGLQGGLPHRAFFMRSCGECALHTPSTLRCQLRNEFFVA